MSVMFPAPQTWAQPAPAAASGVRRYFLARPLTVQFLIAVACAFVLRAWQFGNPVIQIDEQFYLVVGERMLQGAMPFVDIWDRKPVGTFLLYAAIRLLGGEGIVEYQVVATLFAAATAFLIAAIALRFANARGAALAGCVYLVWLLVFDGSGGQTPVFYNAFIAGAALLTLSAFPPQISARRLLGLGAGAMLLAGIALQIKYSVVFEAMFFGCALLWRWSRQGTAARLLPFAAVIWIGCALLPTLAAWAWYAAHGFNDAFVYANFLSIFDRGGWPAATLIGRLATIAGLAFPLILSAWLESRTPRPTETHDARLTRQFALVWLAAAAGGVVLFGTFFVHYFLPVLVPLCLVSAKLLGDPEAGVAAIVGERRRFMSCTAFIAVMGGVAISLTIPKQLKNRGTRADVTAVADAINRERTGCMFVFDGEPILYHLTNACMVTSRIFPNHLNDEVEAQAVGIDPRIEVRRILEVERPDIIVASDRADPHFNGETLDQLRTALRHDYRLVYHRKIGSRQRLVYKRKGHARSS